MFPVSVRLGEHRKLGLLDLLVRGNYHVAGVRVGDVDRKLLVHDRGGELRDDVLLKLRELVLALLFGVLLGLLGRLVLRVECCDVLARGDLHADNDAGRPGRDGERGVADISRLLAEDSPEKALLRGELGLALRRHLADEYVARLDFGADADNAVRTEVLEGLLALVRNVAGDLLWAELRVPRAALEEIDVKRRENVLADDALVDEDGVLEVVSAPAHERDEQVLAECELALVGRWAVC